MRMITEILESPDLKDFTTNNLFHTLRAFTQYIPLMDDKTQRDAMEALAKTLTILQARASESERELYVKKAMLDSLLDTMGVKR